MSRPTKSCDPKLLRRSLEDKLSEDEEESLSAHLCECDDCQNELEELAGQPTAWTRIGAALKAAHSSGQSALQGVSVVHENDVELDAAIDFAVEYLEPSAAPDSIGRLGDIEIQEIIGRGGMGVVLKGYQPELKRLVAVKVLAPQLAVSAASRKRFAREAQATAAILHPNVMPILAVQSVGRLPFIVMPHVVCESLQQRIDRIGPMELLDILRVGMQTAKGLAAAHAQGLVHRDVKPANVLLEVGVEKVILTDFGLARAIDDASITRTGVIAGTPLYMSPEQSRGEPVDARSDLFSLGSVLYTLATGRAPFRAESTYGILRRLTEETPRPLRQISPQLPSWFEMIIHKLLAKQPAERFRTASHVAELLEGCIAHLQQPTTVSLPPECAACDRRRSFPLWLGAAVATMIALISLLAVVTGERAADMQPSQENAQPEVSARSPNGDSPEILSKESYANWGAAEEEVSTLQSDFDQWRDGATELWPESPP